MGIRTRLIAAMMSAAMVTAVVGAATASAAPASQTTSVSSDGKKPGVAASLRVSVKAPSSSKPVPGKDKHGVPEQAVKLLAAELHISIDRARQVFRDLEKVKGRGDAIVKDPAFVAIAKGLGITPQRLIDALIKVKKELVKGEGKPKDKDLSGSPTK